MDWDVIISYLPLYKRAMILTLKIGWMGILFSVLIGFLCAVIRHYRVPVLRGLAGFYIELFRNTPLLVQLFFLYFALPRVGIPMDAEVCGVLGLSLLGGAYMAEAFRSGIEAVDSVQMESALSLGMTRWQAVIHVILPQAISISVPAFVANIIFLLKETSVFSAISLMDLMFTAKDLIGLYYRTVECLSLLVAFYLIILLPVSVIGSLVERRMRYAGFGD
ncbi:MAG: amino acid ABC transporter permease [Eubacteriaceae bacterium]|nr:amino acid ABC transporter permease [Eubacteriaceae bacterium]